MLSGVGIVCFAASYSVALALEISRLLFRSGVRGAVMLGFAGAGLVAHTAYLYYQAVGPDGSRLAGQRDWYLVAAWAVVIVYLYLLYYHPKSPFGLFLLPIALGLIATAHFFADPEPYARPNAARAWWGIAHGVAILLAVVAMLVGFVAGLMYLWQARRLKLKRPAGRGPRLPSLEWLERVNSRSMVISMLMLGFGVASGMVLNLIKYRLEESRLSLNDPVVLSTLVMFGWLVLVVAVGGLYKPARKGRKVAYLTVAGFVFLAIALGMGLFLDTEHQSNSQASCGGAGRVPLLACPAVLRYVSVSRCVPRVSCQCRCERGFLLRTATDRHANERRYVDCAGGHDSSCSMQAVTEDALLDKPAVAPHHLTCDHHPAPGGRA